MRNLFRKYLEIKNSDDTRSANTFRAKYIPLSKLSLFICELKNK